MLNEIKKPSNRINGFNFILRFV